MDCVWLSPLQSQNTTLSSLNKVKPLALALKNHFPLLGVAFLFFRGKIPCKFYPFFCSKNKPAASATEVPSANVVGYTKLNLQPGYSIVGNQFKSVNSSNETLDISQILATGLTGGDQARFWDSSISDYVTIVYYGEENEGGVYTDESYEECLGPGWGDENQILAKHTISVGESFWISSAGASTVTISGEVPTATTKDFAAGFTLVCNPMPKKINLADVKATGLTGGDQARFWDSSISDYVTIVYYGEENEGGVYTDESYEECLGPGWGDENQIIISKEIDVGEGFWISSANSGTLTF